jgi:hypothetical protein
MIVDRVRLASKKKKLTKEEQALRKSEIARRRKNQSERKAEEDKVSSSLSLDYSSNMLLLESNHTETAQEASIQKNKKGRRNGKRCLLIPQDMDKLSLRKMLA